MRKFFVFVIVLATLLSLLAGCRVEINLPTAKTETNDRPVAETVDPGIFELFP